MFSVIVLSRCDRTLFILFWRVLVCCGCVVRFWEKFDGEGMYVLWDRRFGFVGVGVYWIGIGLRIGEWSGFGGFGGGGGVVCANATKQPRRYRKKNLLFYK